MNRSTPPGGVLSHPPSQSSVQAMMLTTHCGEDPSSPDQPRQLLEEPTLERRDGDGRKPGGLAVGERRGEDRIVDPERGLEPLVDADPSIEVR